MKTDLNSVMNQSELEANTCNRRQENVCEEVTIGLTFVSHWLRKWCKFLLTITENSKKNHSKRLTVFYTIEKRSKTKTVIGQLLVSFRFLLVCC